VTSPGFIREILRHRARPVVVLSAAAIRKDSESGKPAILAQPFCFDGYRVDNSLSS
jgi:hypothetical protein